MSGPSDLDRPVDLVRLLQTTVHCSQGAAMTMLAHGHVTIDGYTMALRFSGRWTGHQLYGRMMKTPHGEGRLFGSRLVKDVEQMELC